MFNNMANVCHESGQCETNEFELKSMRFSKTDAKALKVTLDPFGSYPTWIRNGLVDSLRAATKAVAVCTPGTYTNTCKGVTAMAWCPRKKTEFVNCEIPEYLGINYQAPEVANAAPPSMGMDVKSEVEGLGDGCEDAMTALGAIAGESICY